MKIQTIMACCIIGLGGAVSFAQDAPPQERPPREGRPEGGRGPGGPRFVMPLMQALDANNDGVLDQKEIANATMALKKLDKNGDGKLTQEELRPPRPEGGRGPGGPDGNRPRPQQPPPNQQ